MHRPRLLSFPLMDANDFCVLDVETAGGSMNNFPAGFQLLLTGIKHGDIYAMYTGERESIAHLLQFLAAFPGTVVTFAGVRFDLPMLEAWSQQTQGQSLPSLPHYDLLVEIEKAAGHRISLERLCYYTFGEKKVVWDHRRNARVWETEPHLLVDYNRVDLDLTHELFMRVLRREPLFLGDSTVVLPLP